MGIAAMNILLGINLAVVFGILAVVDGNQAVVDGDQLCSEEYECDDTGDSMVGVYHTPTEQLCQAACRVTKTCSYYTWYEETTCFLLSSCVDNKPCSTCHTGPRECTTTEPPNTTNHPEDCANPSRPTNGKFLCDEESKECHLVCDPGAWDYAWDTREGTDGCMVTTGDSQAIMTGGHGCSKCVYKYNMETGASTQLQNMNEGRSSHGCALYQYGGEEYVLVAGGWDGHHNLRSSEVLSLTTGQWRVVGDLRESKRALQLAVIEGGVVVATGGRVGTVVDSVEIFDTEMEQWREGVALTTRRAYHGVTPVPRSKYCFN